MGRTSFLALTLVLLGTPLAAQVVSEGDSLRLRMTGAVAVDATAVLWVGTTLSVMTEGVPGVWSVPIDDLESLEVLRPRTPRDGFRRGFSTGLVAGLFLGAAVGLILHSTGSVGSSSDPQAELLVQTTLRGAGLGAIAGGLTGGFWGGAHPGVGWVQIPLGGRPEVRGRR